MLSVFIEIRVRSCVWDGDILLLLLNFTFKNARKITCEEPYSILSPKARTKNRENRKICNRGMKICCFIRNLNFLRLDFIISPF